MKRVIVAGKLNVDTFFYVDELEVEGNNVASIMKVDLGGKAGNVAVGLRRLGIQVVVTGCVGNDDLGRFVRERLEDAGIDVSHLKVCEGVTGRTSIAVTKDGANTMLNFPGVNASFSPEMIDWTLAEDGDVMFLQFGLAPDTVFELASMAKRAGMMVYVDPSYPSEIPWDAFAYFDYIAPNEREILKISGKGDIEKAVKLFFKKGVESVIVKMGDKGMKFFGPKESFDLPASEDLPIDTTAAGDAFNVGFIYGRLRGLDDRESSKLGIAAAAVAISKRGSSSSMPSLEELKEKLLQLGEKTLESRI